MGFFSFLFGTKHNSVEAQGAHLVEITSRLDPAEGWADIFLKITEETQTDSSHVYVVKGLHKGKPVGLQIEVNSNIGAGIVGGKPDPGAGFVDNGVRFLSIGQESDELAKALAELYQQPMVSGFTKQPISATVFSLNDKPVDLGKKKHYKLKLFFGEDSEDMYAEAYLNINTTAGEIEISEKDQDYRETLIKVWTR